MALADKIITPDAFWDHDKQVCYDPITHIELPNYEGLCLFRGAREPMVMNTWLEGGVRHWELVHMGYAAPITVLEKAS